MRILVLALLFLLCSCSRENHELSFYYWKSSVRIEPTVKSTLNSFSVKKIYVRLFDVGFNTSTNKVEPIAIVKNIDSLKAMDSLIPVIYITNMAMAHMPEKILDSVANNITQLTQEVGKNVSNKFCEYQFDCDWTLETRDNYFKLLTLLKAKLHKPTSATIRLHQIKFKEKTGVPPVDKGMLMFYNIGKLENTSKNSIYNQEDAIKYIKFLTNYPLHLDVAFPLFSWYIQKRKDKIVNLISLSDSLVNDTSMAFEKIPGSENLRIKQSFFHKGIYFKAEDELSLQSLSNEELYDAAILLKKNLKPEKRTIAMFHLSEQNLKDHDNTTIEKILDILN